MKKFIVIAILFAQVGFCNLTQAQDSIKNQEEPKKTRFKTQTDDWDSKFAKRSGNFVAQSEIKKDSVQPVRLLDANRISYSVFDNKESEKTTPKLKTEDNFVLDSLEELAKNFVLVQSKLNQTIASNHVVSERKLKAVKDSLIYLLVQYQNKTEKMFDLLRQDSSKTVVCQSSKDSKGFQGTQGLQGPKGADGAQGFKGKDGVVSVVVTQVPIQTITKQMTILNTSDAQIDNVEKAILEKLQHDPAFAKEFVKNFNSVANGEKGEVGEKGSGIKGIDGRVGENGTLSAEQLKKIVNQVKGMLVDEGLIGVILHPTKAQLDQAIDKLSRDSLFIAQVSKKLKYLPNSQLGKKNDTNQKKKDANLTDVDYDKNNQNGFSKNSFSSDTVYTKIYAVKVIVNDTQYVSRKSYITLKTTYTDQNKSIVSKK